jgi:hypothetical protein
MHLSVDAEKKGQQISELEELLFGNVSRFVEIEVNSVPGDEILQMNAPEM